HRPRLDHAECGQLSECFVNLGDQGAAGHGHDDIVGQPPSELLGNFKSHGLRPFGVVGTQIHVYKTPAVAVGNLSAKAVDVVIVARYRHEPRPVNSRAQHLGGFQVRRNENPRVQAVDYGLRSHRVRQVACGGTSDHLEPKGPG